MSDFRFDGSIAEFDYQGIGERTQQTYLGTFRAKCIISPMDHIKADRLYRELLGTVNPHLASKETQNFAFALSQLKVRLVDFPDFFKNKELNGSHLDSNVLIDIINKSIDAQEEYKEQLDERLKNMQDMLAKRIKNKQIEKEEDIEQEPGTDVDDDDFDEDDLPEVTLGGGKDE